MTVGKYCNREVIIISESESIRDAALLMREYHIGDLVVVQGEVEKRIPVGILTDRDIVVEIDAMSVDPDNVSVGDALSFELVTIGEDADIQAAIHIMRTKGVRRLPVVDKDGILVGILTVDDGLCRIF
jgi:CBS domain-containing protein